MAGECRVGVHGMCRPLRFDGTQGQISTSTMDIVAELFSRDDRPRAAEKDLTNAPTVCDREHLQLLIQRAT
eukprot:s17_g38.t1